MMIRLPIGVWSPAFTCLAWLLAACSAPTVVTPAPVVQASALNLKATRGVIAAVRPVPLGSGQASIEVGVNGVLAGLHQPLMPPNAASAMEYVVQRSDDTGVSLVVPASDGSFSVGERVEVIDGAVPPMIPGN